MTDECRCEDCENFEQCEISIILHNPIHRIEHTINKGDKIAQIELCEHKSYLFGIDTEDERTGGLGSTDDNN